MILSTDIGFHSLTIDKIEGRKKYLLKKSLKRFSDLGHEDKTILMTCLMKSADLSNEIREFSVAKKWADKIMKEFISQSNRESLLNLPLFLDKEKFILSSEQKKFYK